MSYFRPTHYIKSSFLQDQPAQRDNVRVIFSFFGQLLASCLLGFGLLILLTQLVFPWFSFNQGRVLSTPVPLDFLNNAVQARTQARVPKWTVESYPAYFYIYIPKLGISGAKIKTNSSDLAPDDYLGHYQGTALPGQPGNTFIYGHSALRAFYSPVNYKTIFSTLTDLQKGDEVIIDYLDRTLIYKVESSQITEPEKVNPLDQVAPSILGRSYITLMTCVPPGLDTRRLLVRARLVAQM